METIYPNSTQIIQGQVIEIGAWQGSYIPVSGLSYDQYTIRINYGQWGIINNTDRKDFTDGYVTVRRQGGDVVSHELRIDIFLGEAPINTQPLWANEYKALLPIEQQKIAELLAAPEKYIPQTIATAPAGVSIQSKPASSASAQVQTPQQAAASEKKDYTGLIIVGVAVAVVAGVIILGGRK